MSESEDRRGGIRDELRRMGRGLVAPQPSVGPALFWLALVAAWFIGYVVSDEPVFAAIWIVFGTIGVIRLVRTVAARRSK